MNESGRAFDVPGRLLGSRGSPAVIPARLLVEAESLLNDAPDLAEAVLDGRKPLYLAAHQARQRQQGNDRLADEGASKARIDVLTSSFEEHLVGTGPPTGDRDGICKLLRETRDFFVELWGAAEGSVDPS